MPQPLFGRGLSALQLKIIAFTAMVIDHMAVGISLFWKPELKTLYQVMRGVGRLAFPLFCFFIALGAVKSKNRWRYLRRLGVLALLCEIPFDYMWAGRFPAWSAQNTVCTLFLGLLGITLFEEARKRWQEGLWAFLAPLALAAPLLVGRFGKVDYGMAGVLLIYGLYMWQTDLAGIAYYPFFLMMMMAALWIHNPIQLISLLAFFLIFLYNGALGKKAPRYLFYGGYIGHLGIIAVLRFLM